MEHPEFLQKVDWPLLEEQKLTLLRHLMYNEDDVRKIELFEGLINFIDDIQDYAADVMGLGDSVFNLKDE